MAQALRQVTVEFYHRQPLAALQQRQRQRAQPGADFYQRLARPGVDRAHDLIDDADVGQEVLTEALARQVACTAQAGLHAGGSRSSM